MRNRAALFFLAAVLLLTSVALGGCTATDNAVQDFQPDLSVNIVVPYQTTAPTPTPESESPFSISAGGDVKINDTSWVNQDFVSADDAASGENYSQLTLGDSGEGVRKLQQRLKDLKYYTADVSGVFDEETRQAVLLFELTYGTMQTGIATEKMQRLLFASSAPVYGSDEYNRSKSSYYETLQLGDVGSGVLLLQYRLMELGYPIAQPSGQYDEETVRAVALFYVEYGLEPNGIAVVSLQKELFSENARRYSGAESTSTGQAQEAPGTDSAQQSLTTLSEGNIGTLVTRLQERLIELGYLTGTASGTYDARTTEAVKAFQASIGVEQTGIASSELQTQLLSFNAPQSGATAEPEDLSQYRLLQEGDSGDAVYALQQRLVELGYADGTPNGKYGAATVSAVTLFQKTAALAETGVATVSLQLTLFSEDAPRYTASAGATASDRLYPYDIPLADLSEGSEGEAVAYLQRRLAQLEYYRGDADGKYGEGTAQAVEKFQQALCIEPTGTASVSMQQYIYSDAAPKSSIYLYDETKSFAVLSPGDSGDSVTNLQRILWELGYLRREDIVDSVGTYNEATMMAVSSAQLAMGYVEADGVAGVEFQAFVFSKYNVYIKKES